MPVFKLPLRQDWTATQTNLFLNLNYISYSTNEKPIVLLKTLIHYNVIFVKPPKFKYVLYQVRVHECGNFFSIVWYRETEAQERVYVYRHHSGVSKVKTN